MQTRLRLYFFILLKYTIAILAQQVISNDDDFFALSDPRSDFPIFEDSSPDLVAYNTDNELVAGGEEPSLYTPDPPLLQEDSDDESNYFLTASCSSAKNTLKARQDGQILASSCPSTDGISPPVPQLPTTLDEFTNLLRPTNNQDNKEPGLDLIPDSWWPSPLPLTSSDEEDPNCPEGFPYRVCCICNRPFAYSWCHDCLLSRFILSSFLSIYWLQEPFYSKRGPCLLPTYNKKGKWKGVIMRKTCLWTSIMKDSWLIAVPLWSHQWVAIFRKEVVFRRTRNSAAGAMAFTLWYVSAFVHLHTHSSTSHISFPFLSVSSFPLPCFPSQARAFIFFFCFFPFWPLQAVLFSSPPLLSLLFLSPLAILFFETLSPGAWDSIWSRHPALRTWTTFATSGAQGYGPSWRRDFNVEPWRNFAKRWSLRCRRTYHELGKIGKDSILMKKKVLFAYLGFGW